MNFSISKVRHGWLDQLIIILLLFFLRGTYQKQIDQPAVHQFPFRALPAVSCQSSPNSWVYFWCLNKLRYLVYCLLCVYFKPTGNWNDHAQSILKLNLCSGKSSSPLFWISKCLRKTWIIQAYFIFMNKESPRGSSVQLSSPAIVQYFPSCWYSQMDILMHNFACKT